MLCHFKLPMQVDFLASVETPIVTAGSEEAPEAIVMLTPYLAADQKKPALPHAAASPACGVVLRQRRQKYNETKIPRRFPE
jgi:hypothetical protein